MADTLSIETRSRSRSKTPGFENGDSGKKTKKIPTISLIEEEDDVVEVAPSSQVTRTKRQRRSTKATAVDTSGDASIESPKNSQKEVTSKIVVVSSTTTVTETEVKKSTNGNEEATSTTTTTTRVDEPESQSIFNNIFNAIKTSTPILSNKRSKRISYDVSSSTANVNIADHPAYKEYREAGEYWNKYPKTDYTYSQLSPHRRELTNGMVAMPNMSRRSLEKYSERVESMIHNNPLDETYLRRKFLTNTNTSFQKRSSDLQYDSADEVDLTELRKQLQLRRKTVSNNVISRFFLSIISYLYSAYYQTKTSVQGVFGSKQSYVAYTPLRRSSKGGVFTRGFEAVKHFTLLSFSKVYLFLSTIICLDTWILYQRSENIVENRKRKRFLLFLLVLLPLLLLGGTYIYLDPPQNFSLPKISMPKINFPKIKLPSLPTLTMPNLSFSWPKFDFSFPELSWPAWLTFSFTLPTISFEWLKFSRPEWLRVPEFTFPTISFDWLKFSRPEWLRFPDLSFTLPTFNLPSLPAFNFSLPSISLPSFSFSLPSFDFSAYTGYVSDKFVALKDSSGEFLFKIRDVTVDLLNEAQIVWNENFNAVSNAQSKVVISTPAATPVVDAV